MARSILSLVLLLTCLPAAAHTIVAPALVEVRPDGTFDFNVLFRVGPGDEALAFYSVFGTDGLDAIAYDADGECVWQLADGAELEIAVGGTLLDGAGAQTAFVHLVTCGISGSRTVFDVEIEIVPYRARALYWKNGGAIERSALDGGHPEVLIPADEADAATSIALDPVAGRIYFGAFARFAGRIRSSDLAGGNVEEFAITGKSSPLGMGVDLGTRSLLAADPSDCAPGCGSIRRYLLDVASGGVLLVLDEPSAVDVLPGANRMCWGDRFTDVIQCSDLDGNGVHTIVAGTEPTGMAFDPVTAKLYWADQIGSVIRRTNVDGSQPQTIVTGLDSPREVAIDPVGRALYWTDNGSGGGTGTIKRANLDGSHVVTIREGLESAWGLAVDSGLDRVTVRIDAGDKLLWPAVTGAVRYDVVSGALDTRFDAATCIADSVPSLEVETGANPPTGEAVWFLVRAVTATGNGSYDAGGLKQAASRDNAIAEGGGDCL